MTWSWQLGAGDDLHGFTVAAGRPVWVHVWRSLDTGAFEWDGEVLGMGGEPFGCCGQLAGEPDGWCRDDAQCHAERWVAHWADRELARQARQSLRNERWYVEHPEWGEVA